MFSLSFPKKFFHHKKKQKKKKKEEPQKAEYEEKDISLEHGMHILYDYSANLYFFYSGRRPHSTIIVTEVKPNNH